MINVNVDYFPDLVQHFFIEKFYKKNIYCPILIDDTMCMWFDPCQQEVNIRFNWENQEGEKGHYWTKCTRAELEDFYFKVYRYSQ